MQIVEAAKVIWSPVNIVETVLPIGVGFAIPMMYREPILERLPEGVVRTLGRFGTAAVTAGLATGTAILNRFVVPEPYRKYGYLAASAMLAVAGYDAAKAIVAPGHSSMTAPLYASPSKPPVPQATVTVKPAPIQSLSPAPKPIEGPKYYT
jgi:hypothetical protein